MKNIDYYIYIDYSDTLIGYIIIKKEKVNVLLPKISKFHHYKYRKHKRAYLSSIKKVVNKEKILEDLLKLKIKKIRDNLYIFTEVIEFIKKNDNCVIFASIDNNQFNAFIKLLKLLPHKDHVIVRRESDLKKGSIEYKLSLIIDTILNLKRSE